MSGLVPAIHCRQTSTMPKGYVYMLPSKKNGTLYIGVTNNLPARMHQHKTGQGAGFTKKYGVHRLVWYETCDMVTDAIQRETTMKHWPRQWKINLIEKDNPEWNDLSLHF